jgi:hypothetical protein
VLSFKGDRSHEKLHEAVAIHETAVHAVEITTRFEIVRRLTFTEARAVLSHMNEHYEFSGLFSSSGILNTRKHNVSETGSVSILRRGEGDTYSVGSLRRS